MKELDPKSLDALTSNADQYLSAHKINLCSKKGQDNDGSRSSNEHQRRARETPSLRPDVQRSVRKCFLCGRPGHLAKDCRTRWESNAAPKPTSVASCKVREKSSTNCSLSMALINGLPVTKGFVGDTSVSVLRDTGCNGVIVNKDLISDEQFTDGEGTLKTVDLREIKAPVAKVTIRTPFYEGEVRALCLREIMHDVILGNIEGARNPDDPKKDWLEVGAVTTRMKAREERRSQRPLAIKAPEPWPATNKSEFEEEQKKDSSLDKLRDLTQEKIKGEYTTKFEERDGLLYRLYQHPKVNYGRWVTQLVVPHALRQKTMEVAHDSIMSGHLGVKKTLDRIQSSFYWTGIRNDVKRFCRSCDVCQRTMDRGKARRVPLQQMPVIETPFKRVAVDLIGPIHPPSKEGHRYVFTLVDYATRYPEAIALKSITTEAVAEALVTIYSRVGLPEEVLSDMGTQFTSECMQEVERLLSVKHISTSPYHPQCNGLTEKFNGTLKKMLKRMCIEQPNEWHRYINPLLFAYRQVPQETTGFEPFELLFGRSIRGPIQILRELWSNDQADSVAMNSYRYVLDLKERMEQTLKLVKEETERAQLRYKKNYDRKTKQRSFEIGDWVLVLLPTDANKLLMQWKGPFMIDNKIGSNNYSLKVGSKFKTFHINLLKKYHKREDDSLQVLASVASDAVEPDMENLVEFAPIEAKETAADVQYGDQLTSQQKRGFVELVSEYADVFSDLPGSFSGIEHRVVLTNNKPVKTKPYPVPFRLQETLHREIDTMLNLGIIRPSASPYASPVVTVRKKDGTHRVCIDYRKLNKLTVFDPEPMTSAIDVFEKMSGDCCFTTIDLTKGYWQIGVAEEDIYKTAFVIDNGTYEFVKMPFGMKNSSATFVRAMRKILNGIVNVECYVDDIVIHTKTLEDHYECLEQLLQRFRDAGVTVRPSKCVVGSNRASFLGHSIESGRIGLHEDNVFKIKNARRPQTNKETRSLLGLTGYYRDYLPHYAEIAAPLYDLTKKGKPNRVVWGDREENAFAVLKEKLLCKPLLKLPDMQKPFVLWTNASDLGLGAVLLQTHDGELFPVSYASRRLSNSEKNYSTIERECLAIIWALKKFEIYLYGGEFILQTDHEPLVYLNRAKFVNDRVMRWAMVLQNYDIKYESIKGDENVGADYMSRI